MHTRLDALAHPTNAQPEVVSPSAAGKMFFGWVPTVSGYLSFSVLGSASQPTPVTNANIADSQDRYILCYQKRPSTDAIFPLLMNLLPRLREGDGDAVGMRRESALWFVCLAHCEKGRPDGDRALNGTVFIFEDSVWKEEAREKVSDEQNNLLALDNSSCGVLRESFGRSYNTLNQVLSCESAIYANFCLERNGILKLEVFDHGSGPNRENQVDIRGFNPKSDEASIADLASQIYFYIRDISHNHQHHDAKSDQLTTLYPENSDDKSLWLRRTYYHLMTHVIDRRRTRDHAALESALGMLTYAKILHDLAVSSIDSEKTSEKFGKKSYKKEFLIKSIEAKISAMRENRKSSHDVRSFGLSGIAFFLSLTAVNLSITNIGKSKDHHFYLDEFYVYLANFFMTHPYIINAVAFSLFVFYLTFRMSRKSGRFIRTLFRILVLSKKKWGVLIAFAIAAAFLSGAWATALILIPTLFP